MKHMIVAGARPNFMKVAPILRTLRDRNEEALLVHTGQHYDFEMSANFFRQLSIPDPEFHLGVGSGSHAEQTARIMLEFEPVIRASRPDWLVVVGDVNSTLACSLVAVKLRDETGSRIAHVEAGLRSRDWRMPEEINRVLTDRVSDLLLTTSPEAENNLVAEGIDPEKIVHAGNVMIDTLLHELSRARDLRIRDQLGINSARYAVVTLHRPSNVDDPGILREILAALVEISSDALVILPLHPRTQRRIQEFGYQDQLRSLRCLEPIGYLEMLSLMDTATAVLTDSGGIQEETTVLGVPCVTLRETTERPVTVTSGTNRMVEWPPTREGIVRAWLGASGQERVPVGAVSPPGWDGRASERIVAALLA